MLWFIGVKMAGSVGIVMHAVYQKNWPFAVLYFGVLLADAATAYLAWDALGG
jgi:hypothetical protein